MPTTHTPHNTAWTNDAEFGLIVAMEMWAVMVWCWLDLFSVVRVYRLYWVRDGPGVMARF